MVNNPDSQEPNKIAARERKEVVKRPESLPVKSETQVSSDKQTAKPPPDVDPKKEFNKALAKIDSEIKGSKVTSKGTEEVEKREELNNTYIIPKGDHAVVRILISVLLLGFALAGFWLLTMRQAVLWFLFLFLAYPLCLAFTTNVQQLERTDLIKMYEIGMSQVPIIGNLLAKIFFRPKDAPKDSETL